MDTPFGGARNSLLTNYGQCTDNQPRAMRAHSPGSIPRGSWAEMKAAVGLRQTAADIVTASVASSVCCAVILV